MREVIKALQALQAIDQEMRSLAMRRSERPLRARESEDIFHKAKGKLEALKTDIRNLQKTADLKEVDLLDREEKIQKLEVQLNTSKSQKDYDAIRHQMSSFRADNSVLEDEILRIMTEIDAAKSQIGTIEQESARRKAQFDEVSRQVAGEVAELDRQIGELKARRAELSKGVPTDSLDRYNRVVSSRDGMGLAPVLDPRGEATCGGCNMSLTLHEVTLVMRSQNLIQCKSCNRILYIPGE